jgi:hypothetical protein
MCDIKQFLKTLLKNDVVFICDVIVYKIEMTNACHLLTRWFAELFFYPEDRGDTFLRNVGCNSTDYTMTGTL